VLDELGAPRHWAIYYSSLIRFNATRRMHSLNPHTTESSLFKKKNTTKPSLTTGESHSSCNGGLGSMCILLARASFIRCVVLIPQQDFQHH